MLSVNWLSADDVSCIATIAILNESTNVRSNHLFVFSTSSIGIITFKSRPAVGTVTFQDVLDVGERSARSVLVFGMLTKPRLV